MKGAWHREQALAKEVKEDHQRHQTREQLNGSHHTDEAGSLGEGHLGQLLQARGADDTIVVFRDAFAAVELGALGTPRCRLAERVIEAALVSQASHASIVATISPGVKKVRLSAIRGLRAGPPIDSQARWLTVPKVSALSPG